MKIFENLAAQVASDWAQSGNKLETFTALATTALQNFKYDWSLSQLDSQLKNWALTHQTLPPQISVHNSFGQPSITVFNNGQFVVDLYFWIDFDTSIHSHGFRGAFKVIHGESVQETFTAPMTKKISHDLHIVDMSEVKTERLQEGSIRTISPGHDLTHRVIHLAKPTVSLCVKTINEPELKQWTYLTTGLAVQKQNLSPDLIKKVYVYQYLLIRDSAAETDLGAAFLKSLLDTLKVSEQIHLYEEAASGSLDLSEETAHALTGAILERHENEEWWTLYEEAYLNQEDPEDIKARALSQALTST